jgi:hypothetical protein
MTLVKDASWPENVTSWMLRNLSNRYTYEELLEEFLREGFEGAFDFLYVPVDFTTKKNKGYGFVNLRTHELAVRFYEVFQGRRLTKYATKKVLEMMPADTQGFEACAVAYLKQQAGRVQNPWFRPIIFVQSEQGSTSKYRIRPLTEGNLPEPYRSRLADLLQKAEKGKGFLLKEEPNGKKDDPAAGAPLEGLPLPSPRIAQEILSIGAADADAQVCHDESSASEASEDLLLAMQESVQEFLRECDGPGEADDAAEKPHRRRRRTRRGGGGG